MAQRPAIGTPLTTPLEAPSSAPPLFRELVGDVLRARRHETGQRLVDVADRAGISPQYLSEIERGVKDPSSEMLAAVAEAMGLTLEDLLLEVVGRQGSAMPPVVQLRAHSIGFGSPLTRTIDPVCRAA